MVIAGSFGKCTGATALAQSRGSHPGLPEKPGLFRPTRTLASHKQCVTDPDALAAAIPAAGRDRRGLRPTGAAPDRGNGVPGPAPRQVAQSITSTFVITSGRPVTEPLRPCPRLMASTTSMPEVTRPTTV